MKCSLAVFLFFAAFFCVTSCDNTTHSKVAVIGFSQCTGADSWRRQMLAEMEAELQFHPELQLVYEDARGNNELQIRQINALIAKKVDLLIVTPNEAAPLTPAIEKAHKSGIPVIIVDRKTVSNLYTAFIGANNFEIGKLAGNYAASLLNGKGKILEIWGLKGSTPAIDRHTGFIEAIKKHPGMTIKGEIDGFWEVDSAKAALVKRKIAPEDYDLVFSHNDVMAFGAQTVLKDPDHHLKFIGIDGLSGPGNGIEMVADGILDATFLYPTGGEEAIQLASRILKGERIEKEILLSSTLVDARSVRVMKLQTDKILSQQNNIRRQQARIDEQIRIYSNQRILIYFLMAITTLAIVAGGYVILAWKEKTDLNKRLETKNSEIELQRDKIEEMAKVAENANQVKLNFFTYISHEFKTPLTLIMGPIEAILSDKINDKGSVRSNALLVKYNAIRLLRLVTQLMDFRKIENKRMTPHVSETDFIAFVKDIVSAFNEVAKKRKIHFELNTTLERTSLFFDPDMLDKVIFNLLSNAFKFTRDRGKINVSIELDRDARNLLLLVEDNGEGMSEEAVERAFDPFYSSNTVHGTGLGLALSKEFINLHHGEIVVSSGKGVGTRFIVTLPLGDSHYNRGQVAAEPVSFTRNSDFDVIADENLPEQTRPVTPAEQHKHSILIIEDNGELRTFLREHLSKYFAVEEAANGVDGLRKAFELIPDLIVSDVILPGKNGFEAASILKNDSRTSHIPIVLLTAKASIEEKIAGIQLGIDEYVTKPFDMTFLYARIKALIKNRESLREHYSQEVPLENNSFGAGTLDRKFVSDFKALVEKNIANADFSVNEMGPELAMSRVQLYRKVKALMGYSVNDYVVNVRLKKAKHLLLNTPLTIAEIASEVGFSSPNYFSTAFKAKYNISPKDFKSVNTA